MSYGRLSNVVVLAVERERTMSTSNEVIDAFAAAHQNRRIALHWIIMGQLFVHNGHWTLTSKVM